MQNLFLTSSFADTADLLDNWLAENRLPKELVFIPTAANVESYTGYIDDAYARFAALGIRVEIMDIAALSEAEIKTRLENAPVLAVSGGNTFYLLQEMQQKNLPEFIRRRIASGMAYAGESAGAVLSAPDIDYIHEMDNDKRVGNTQDNQALALVDFYLVPHVGEEPFAEAGERILARYRNRLNLLPINNRQAVVVKGQNREIRHAE